MSGRTDSWVLFCYRDFIHIVDHGDSRWRDNAGVTKRKQDLPQAPSSRMTPHKDISRIRIFLLCKTRKSSRAARRMWLGFPYPPDPTRAMPSFTYMHEPPCAMRSTGILRTTGTIVLEFKITSKTAENYLGRFVKCKMKLSRNILLMLC